MATQYADPTLAFLAKLDDTTKYVAVHNVPIFVPHDRETTDKDGKPMNISVGVEDLGPIAAQINQREAEFGVPPVMTIGHRQQANPAYPEQMQPAVVGYVRNAHVGVFGPASKPAVLATLYYSKEEWAESKKYPFRSVDFYPGSNKVTGLALLKRDPFLPMGVVSYQAPTTYDAAKNAGLFRHPKQTTCDPVEYAGGAPTEYIRSAIETVTGGIGGAMLGGAVGMPIVGAGLGAIALPKIAKQFANSKGGEPSRRGPAPYGIAGAALGAIPGMALGPIGAIGGAAMGHMAESALTNDDDGSGEPSQSESYRAPPGGIILCGYNFRTGMHIPPKYAAAMTSEDRSACRVTNGDSGSMGAQYISQVLKASVAAQRVFKPRQTAKLSPEMIPGKKGETGDTFANRKASLISPGMKMGGAALAGIGGGLLLSRAFGSKKKGEEPVPEQYAKGGFLAGLKSFGGKLGQNRMVTHGLTGAAGGALAGGAKSLLDGDDSDTTLKNMGKGAAIGGVGGASLGFLRGTPPQAKAGKSGGTAKPRYPGQEHWTDEQHAMLDGYHPPAKKPRNQDTVAPKMFPDDARVEGGPKKGVGKKYGINKDKPEIDLVTHLRDKDAVDAIDDGVVVPRNKTKATPPSSSPLPDLQSRKIGSDGNTTNEWLEQGADPWGNSAPSFGHQSTEVPVPYWIAPAVMAAGSLAPAAIDAMSPPPPPQTTKPVKMQAPVNFAAGSILKAPKGGIKLGGFKFGSGMAIPQKFAAQMTPAQYAMCRGHEETAPVATYGKFQSMSKLRSLGLDDDSKEALSKFLTEEEGRYNKERDESTSQPMTMGDRAVRGFGGWLGGNLLGSVAGNVAGHLTRGSTHDRATRAANLGMLGGAIGGQIGGWGGALGAGRKTIGFSSSKAPATYAVKDFKDAGTSPSQGVWDAAKAIGRIPLKMPEWMAGGKVKELLRKAAEDERFRKAARMAAIGGAGSGAMTLATGGGLRDVFGNTISGAVGGGLLSAADQTFGKPTQAQYASEQEISSALGINHKGTGRSSSGDQVYLKATQKGIAALHGEPIFRLGRHPGTPDPTLSGFTIHPEDATKFDATPTEYGVKDNFRRAYKNPSVRRVFKTGLAMGGIAGTAGGVESLARTGSLYETAKDSFLTALSGFGSGLAVGTSLEGVRRLMANKIGGVGYSNISVRRNSTYPADRPSVRDSVLAAIKSNYTKAAVGGAVAGGVLGSIRRPGEGESRLGNAAMAGLAGGLTGAGAVAADRNIGRNPTDPKWSRRHAATLGVLGGGGGVVGGMAMGMTPRETVSLAARSAGAGSTLGFIQGAKKEAVLGGILDGLDYRDLNNEIFRKHGEKMRGEAPEDVRVSVVPGSSRPGDSTVTDQGFRGGILPNQYDDHDDKKVVTAPTGGIILNGRKYEGGTAIPNSIVAEMPPDQRARCGVAQNEAKPYWAKLASLGSRVMANPIARETITQGGIGAATGGALTALSGGDMEDVGKAAAQGGIAGGISGAAMGTADRFFGDSKTPKAKTPPTDTTSSSESKMDMSKLAKSSNTVTAAQYLRLAKPTRYEAVHAPAGGVSVGGHKFVGGQFIPSDVMAKASPAEKIALGNAQKTSGKEIPSGHLQEDLADFISNASPDVREELLEHLGTTMTGKVGDYISKATPEELQELSRRLVEKEAASGNAAVSPKNGVTIRGYHFAEGQSIPPNFLRHATPEQLKEIEGKSGLSWAKKALIACGLLAAGAAGLAGTLYLRKKLKEGKTVADVGQGLWDALSKSVGGQFKATPTAREPTESSPPKQQEISIGPGGDKPSSPSTPIKLPRGARLAGEIESVDADGYGVEKGTGRRAYKFNERGESESKRDKWPWIVDENDPPRPLKHGEVFDPTTQKIITATGSSPTTLPPSVHKAQAEIEARLAEEEARKKAKRPTRSLPADEFNRQRFLNARMRKAGVIQGSRAIEPRLHADGVYRDKFWNEVDPETGEVLQSAAVPTTYTSVPPPMRPNTRDTGRLPPLGKPVALKSSV